MGLSHGQLKQFDIDGYLVVKNVLKNSDLYSVINEYETHINQRAKEFLEDGRITDLFADAPFEKRLALINDQCTEIYSDLDIFQLRGKATFAFLRNERLIDLVESLVGPEIICSPIQHIRCKLPYGKTRLGGDTHTPPWHQDAGVTLEAADPHFILTVWLPLVSTTSENGCLQIIPGQHKSGLLQHQTVSGLGTVILEELMPNEEPLVLPMEKGDVLLMHKGTPHRSSPNFTDSIRWSMDMRYQKKGTPTGRSIYPEFVVRSRSCPESVLTDHHIWSKMWEDALTSEVSKGTAHHRWEVTKHHHW